jgi:hypothetical protein
MARQQCLRVLLLVGVAPACNDRTIASPDSNPTAVDQKFVQPLSKAADILFLVDDSSSMTPVQQNLSRNFKTFIDALKLPEGLPDLHIAVTTSSRGAGAFTAVVDRCATPDLGNFVARPRGTDPACGSVQLTGNEHFIDSAQNGTVNNFPAGLDISDVFSCIARVGDTGCGFEHQLAAVRAALGDPTMGLAAPTGNQGFLRDEAFLAVIFITNEDDCSAPPDSLLFDPDAVATLGPEQSFRCTRFGILCGGRPLPLSSAGPLSGCASNDGAAADDPLHALFPVRLFIDYFRRLKASPDRLVLAAIAAPPEPFTISQLADGSPCLAHSCGPIGSVCDTPTGDAPYGDPAVRLKQVIDSAGDNGSFLTICQDSYQQAMQTIATRLRILIGKQCIDHPLIDHNGARLMAAPDQPVDPTRLSCTVEDVRFLGTPTQTGVGVVPPCDPRGQASGACYAILGDPECTLSGARVIVCRNGFDPTNPAMPCPAGPTPPPGTTSIVQCSTTP